MSTTEITPEQARERLVLKAKERRERIDANHEKAAGIIQSGDESFNKGDFTEALEFYSEAARLWNTNVDLLIKLATVHVKCIQYEKAVTVATRVLNVDPSNIEARYQRGLARLEQYKAGLAFIDFANILEEDPTHSGTLSALERAKKQLNSGKGKKKALARDIDVGLTDPLFEEEGIEEVDLSDSEDSKMVGNGVACRHYNKKPAGCREGLNCKWMHAPDDKSVRDTTGRNVCIYYLFDCCRFGEKCFYLHDREWLPSDGWWNDHYKVARMEEIVEMAARKARIAQHGNQIKRKSNRRGKKKTKGRKKQNTVASSGGFPAWMTVSMDPYDDEPNYGLDYELDASDDDYDYRMLNFGFSQGDMEELMCQGVKPWDDDAWGVLHALSSY